MSGRLFEEREGLSGGGASRQHCTFGTATAQLGTEEVNRGLRVEQVETKQLLVNHRRSKLSVHQEAKWSCGKRQAASHELVLEPS
jgi:hypothetical protein